LEAILKIHTGVPFGVKWNWGSRTRFPSIMIELRLFINPPENLDPAISESPVMGNPWIYPIIPEVGEIAEKCFSQNEKKRENLKLWLE
jgi:hypothetical protein